MLADGAGSNGCRPGAWKTELQSQLCNGFDQTVPVAHYPIAASKWNPIEDRFLSEISKNGAAEPLDSHQNILNLIRTTSTQNGPAVSAYLNRRHYQTGNPPDPDLFRQLRLTGANTLPDWNYTIATQP